MSRIGVNDGAKQIELHLPATTSILRHTFYERRSAVLDPTPDRKDPLTPSRRIAGGVEHMHALLPDDAARRVSLRSRSE